MNIEDNKNSILVLGAGGFIGTNLCRRLISDGLNVKLFDRPGTNYDAIVKYTSELNKTNFELIEGDFGSFSDARLSNDILGDVDTVYHLISTTCPTNSNQDIAGEIESNVVATIRFLDACVANKVSKIVFLSSGGTVYGKEHDGIVSEEDEACPISSYGIQKLTIEKMLYLYHELYELDYRIVRLSNPFGPYQRPNGVQGVVSTFTWKAMKDETISIYGDGSVVRDYIYIDDAINGIVNIASDNAKYRLYNLGSGVGTSVNQVAECISNALNKKLDISYTPGRQVDVPKNVLNIARYITEFGNPVSISLEEGIRKLSNFYSDLIYEKD